MTYKRKTKDVFIVEGNYGYGHGWESECWEKTWAEGKQRLKEYRENGPGDYRLIKRREKIES